MKNMILSTTENFSYTPKAFDVHMESGRGDRVSRLPRAGAFAIWGFGTLLKGT